MKKEKGREKRPSIGRSMRQSAREFLYVTPMLLGVFLLVGLLETIITREVISSLFSGRPLQEMIMGTFLGGISAGHPLSSYIIAGELLERGVSMYAVTAFVISWVTLGVVQLPLEYRLFGKRFTVQRNLLSLVFAMLIAFLVVETLKLFT